jgi:hypothetical protein
MDNKNIDRCDLVYLLMFLECLASSGVQRFACHCRGMHAIYNDGFFL